jgi:hypothetical protein
MVGGIVRLMPPRRRTWRIVIGMVCGCFRYVSRSFLLPNTFERLAVSQNVGSSANELPPLAPQIKAFVNGLNTAITDAQHHGDFFGYPNYLDPELTPTEAHRLYYGVETYGKLLGLKKTFDPKAVFWNPQAIGD